MGRQLVESRSYIARIIAKATTERQFHKDNAISLMRIAADRLIELEVVRKLEFALGMGAIGIFTSNDGQTEIIVHGNLNYKNPEDPDQVELSLGKLHAPENRNPSGNTEKDKPKPINASPTNPQSLIDALLEKFAPPIF